MKRTGDLQVGVTVLVAVVILVFGVLWFKEFSSSRDTWNLIVYLEQASGLAKGDPVEVAGVVQGRVGELTYEQGRAKLVLTLDESAELYRDTRVAISNFGIMGQKFVAIDPGTPAAGRLERGATLEGHYESGVGDVMVEVGRAIDTMQSLAGRLDHFLAAIDSAGGAPSMVRTMKNVEKFSADLADVSGSTRVQLKRAVANFDSGAAGLRSVLNDKGPQLRGTLDSAARASARLDTLTTELNHLSGEIRGLVDKLNSGQGSVGAAINDRELYDRLLATIARTDSLLIDFKKNPHRYVKFSVF